MDWLQSIDNSLFYFINHRLKNSFFDWVMPFLSGNAIFIPILILLGAWLLCRGGTRGRLFVGLALLILFIGDNAIINALKQGVNRPRPFLELTDAFVLVGRGGSGSFPSSHTSNWFAASVLCLVFYRKVWPWILVLAGVGLLSF